MDHWWWKALSVALLLGASIAALRVPLAAELVGATPERLHAGTVTVDVTGYATHFTAAGPRAWLQNDGQRLCAERIAIGDDLHLSATFNVPPGLRKELTSLVVVSADGELILPERFWTDDRGTGINERPCGNAATAGAPRTAAFSFPNRTILYESIRNLCFHVPMWFTMIVLMSISFTCSLIAIQKNSPNADLAAVAAAKTGLVFCMLGLITGSIWARFTWGAWWTSDVKLNGAAVGALIYLAYLVLRGSVAEPHKRMRLAGVYNIFAFSLLIVLLFVLPRLQGVDTLHPGSGGNPAFNQYDLDDRLRAVFYPAVIGWVGMGVWMWDLERRSTRIKTLSER